MRGDEQQLERARLAYLSAGRAPLSAPRRAAEPPDDEHSVGASGVGQQDWPAPHELGHHAALTEQEDSLTGSVPVLPAQLRRPWWHPTRAQVLAIMLVLLASLGVAGLAIGRSSAQEVPLETPTPSVSFDAVPTPSATPAATRIRVHVAGEVEYPGVIELPPGAIVQEAIAAAGGLSKDADPAALNLAATLADGQQILIGSLEDPRGEISEPSSASAAPGQPLNLNVATVSELEQLPGIGAVTAASIVAWRERNGQFSTLGELQEVDGIGPKTLARLEGLVAV